MKLQKKSLTKGDISITNGVCIALNTQAIHKHSNRLEPLCVFPLDGILTKYYIKHCQSTKSICCFSTEYFIEFVNESSALISKLK